MAFCSEGPGRRLVFSHTAKDELLTLEGLADLQSNPSFSISEEIAKIARTATDQAERRVHQIWITFTAVAATPLGGILGWIMGKYYDRLVKWGKELASRLNKDVDIKLIYGPDNQLLSTIKIRKRIPPHSDGR